MGNATLVGAHESIPEPLQRHRRWCTWHLARNAGGRPTKRPDQSTLQLEACRDFAAVAGTPRTADGGVGFVLTRGVAGELGTLVALDLDACRDPATKSLAGWAQTVLRMFPDAYAEVSPSGAGLRVWLEVRDVSAIRRAKVRIDAPPLPEGTTKGAELQVFGARGAAEYVTVTGNPPQAQRWCVVDDLEQLAATFGLDCDDTPAARLPAGQGPAPALVEITAGVLAEPRGRELIAGQWKETHAGASASEAFHALAQLAVRAARGHGEAAVTWLLAETAWGRGEIDDSADPVRYTRRAWVSRDVARTMARPAPVPMSEVFRPLESHELNGQQEKPVSRLITHAEFLRRRATQLFLVRDVLPRTGVIQFFGEPNAGKTPFALSLAMHVAGGRETWFGYDVERHGGVVYMVGEDANGLGWRAEAEQVALGIDGAILEQNLRWTTEPGRLCDAEDVARWAREVQACFPAGTALVLVDTQSRNFGDGDENSTRDMTTFTNNLARLAEILGCAIMLTHHTGHTNKDRARGSSVLFGALDASFEVTQGDGLVVTAKPNKAKNWSKPAPLVGQLVPRVVGRDDRGREITAITLVTAAPVMDGFAALSVAETAIEGAPELRAALVAVAAVEGRPATYDDIAEASGGAVLRNQLRRGLISRLLDIGLVEVESEGGGRGKGAVYRLTEIGKMVCMMHS